MARSRVKRLLAALVALALMAVLAVGLLLLRLRAPGGVRETVVEIPRGAGTRRIAELLEKERVLSGRWQFLAVRLFRPRAVLQAGEYQFPAGSSPWSVFDKIARGDIHYYEVTIPEGSNLFDIARILDEQHLISAAAFRAEAANTALIRDLAPQAANLEGYLFPSTYRVTRRTTAAQLVKEMTQQFRRAWKQAAGTGNVHEAITLASLVEKETAVPAERPVVASVYRNRLDRGMKLDCDPTTIYAALLEGRYRGTIYRSDLDSPHPYNTYHHPGLPPGPIANPGLRSIQAALHPAATDYLFFVARADGSGGHVFSESAAQHQTAVAEYRRGQKGKAGTTAARTP